MAAPRKPFDTNHRSFTRAGKDYRELAFKLPEGGWKTVQVPVSHTTEAEAEEWFRTTYLPAHYRQAAVVAAPSVPTIRSLATAWLRLIEKTKSYTLNESNLRLHILPHALADLDLSKLAQKDDEALQDSMALAAIEWTRELRAKVSATTGRPLSNNSILSIINTARIIINDAKTLRMVDGQNRRRISAYTPNLFSHADVAAHINEHVPSAKLIDAHDPTAKVIKTLPNAEAISLFRNGSIAEAIALATGFRSGEVFGLSWSAILSARDQQTNETVAVFDLQQQLKSGAFVAPKWNSKRMVPIHPALAVRLAEWREGGCAMLLGRQPLPSDPICPAEDGGFAVPSQRARGVRARLQKLGFSGTFRFTVRGTDGAVVEKVFNHDFHSLRRTFATMINAAGADEETRETLLGHRIPGVSAESYLAGNLKKRAEAVARLPFGA